MDTVETLWSFVLARIEPFLDDDVVKSPIFSSSFFFDLSLS